MLALGVSIVDQSLCGRSLTLYRPVGLFGRRCYIAIRTSENFSLFATDLDGLYGVRCMVLTLTVELDLEATGIMKHASLCHPFFNGYDP